MKNQSILSNLEKTINEQFGFFEFLLEGNSKIDLVKYKAKKEHLLEYKGIIKRLDAAAKDINGRYGALEFISDLDKLNNYKDEVDVASLKNHYQTLYYSNH